MSSAHTGTKAVMVGVMGQKLPHYAVFCSTVCCVCYTGVFSCRLQSGSTVGRWWPVWWGRNSPATLYSAVRCVWPPAWRATGYQTVSTSPRQPTSEYNQLEEMGSALCGGSISGSRPPPENTAGNTAPCKFVEKPDVGVWVCRYMW